MSRVEDHRDLRFEFRNLPEPSPTSFSVSDTTPPAHEGTNLRGTY